MVGVKILIHGNVRYLSGSGLREGFVFIDSGKVAAVGEEPEPEYELSELVLKYERPALVVHGFSAVIPSWDLPFRGLPKRPQRHSLGREAAEKIVEASLSLALSRGVTLPAFVEGEPEVVLDVLRKHEIRGVVISDKSFNSPYALGLLVREGVVTYEGRVLGRLDEILCSPRSVKEGCIFVDARAEQALSPQAWLSAASEPRAAFEALRKPYVALGIDSGFVDSGAEADLLVYDLGEESIALPPSLADPVVAASRGGPQVVIARGDLAYEKGESLAVVPPDLSKVLGSL